MVGLDCGERLLGVVEEAVPRLMGLDAGETARKPGPGKWSKREILGHLIDSASNNHQRFVRAQAVERLVFPPYAQDHWVACQGYNEREWAELVGLWVAYNRHLAHVMGRCREEALPTPCVIEYNDPVTLAWLMSDYIDHMEHHLGQVLERT